MIFYQKIKFLSKVFRVQTILVMGVSRHEWVNSSNSKPEYLAIAVAVTVCQ